MQQFEPDTNRLRLVAMIITIVGLVTALAGAALLIYMAVADPPAEGNGSLWAVGAILIVVGLGDIGISEWMRRAPARFTGGRR